MERRTDEQKGAGDGTQDGEKRKLVTRYDLGKRWHRFRVLTPTCAILRGSFAMNDLHFKFLSRGRQASACSVVAIVYGRLFEAKDWTKDFVDQILEYGDVLFRASLIRSRIKDNEYMKTDLLHPEFFVGSYKIVICVEDSGISGTLFTEAPGCPGFEDGLRKFLQDADSGVITAQGTSVAVWRQPGVGFLLFDCTTCAEDGSRDHGDGVACVMRFKCMNEMRDHFLKNMDHRFDSCYCIDKVTILRVNEVGRRYLDRVPFERQPKVDKSVIRQINPVDIEENKMDCTKPVPKEVKQKLTTVGKIVKEPLLITISNYTLDRKFATVPLVDQTNFDTGYQYEGMHVTVPPIFKDIPGRMSILHGLTHENSEMYRGKGAQNVANCVMALAMKKVHPVRTWARERLDQVLAMGDVLYAETKAEKPAIKSMTAADLDDKKIDIEGRKMVVDADLVTCIGTMSSKVSGVLNLRQALIEFFLINNEGVLETSSNAVAIWNENDCIYAFDPRQCDGNGARMIEEKAGKGGKGGDAGKDKKPKGMCCVIRFPDSDALANLFMGNIDRTKRNDRFTIRRLSIVEDVPGTREWHDFKPGTHGESWVLRGTIANDDESLEESSRGIQGLAMPVIGLVTAKDTPVGKWSPQTVDEVVREGDAYFNWCNPAEEGEEEAEPKGLTISGLKKQLYFKNRKVKFDVDECSVVGQISHTPQEGMLSLEKGLKKFFDEHTYGIVEAKNYSAAIWKAEGEEKGKGEEKPMSYYIFDPLPRNALGLTTTEEGGTACVVRAAHPHGLANIIETNFVAVPQQDNEYTIHEIKNISIGTPMTEEEVEADKQIPLMPDMNNYLPIGDTGAILLGSFDQSNEVAFKRATRDKQQSAVAVAALGMTKLYEPRLWYREVVDDILKIGDKITGENLENIPEVTDEDEDPRNYLLPMELGDEFVVGVNKFSVILEEENSSGKMFELPTTLERFFEGTAMGIFRQDSVIMPIWKENNVFFTFDPRGRDSRGEPRERDGSAAAMWFTDLPSLASAIQAAATGDEFVIDGITMENAYETRLAEAERLKRTTSGEDLWHHFPKMDPGVWSLGGSVTMENERFNPANAKKQSAAIAAMAVVFAKVYQPHYWTSAIVDELIVTGDKLHSKCVQRLGAGIVPRVNQIITQFFLSDRRIDLNVEDCVQAGDLAGKPPKAPDLLTGINAFFRKHDAGILTVHGTQNIAIWKYQNVYYCLIPDWGVNTGEEDTHGPRAFRFLDSKLLVQYLLKHLGERGDYEITAVDVQDSNKLPPWKFDPSPAVRPDNLPPLNAYKKLPGEARAILRGNYHEGDEIFPENVRNVQTASNCVVALGMSVVKSCITWTKRTMDEIMAMGSSVHKESKKAKPIQGKPRPWDIIRVFYIGVNILTADIESDTVKGQVAIPPPEPEEKGKKKGKKPKKPKKDKKAKVQRVRPPPPPPIMLEDGLKKFFQNNRAGILVTGRGMIAIWKENGVYFMYDSRTRSDQGLHDVHGTSCTMWFACMEPFYDVIFANIDIRERYGPYEICRVIIKTVIVEPLPCPAGFRPYFDCISPPIPVQPPKKNATLAVETITEYNIVDEDLSVLKGSLHMFHRQFSLKSRGFQGTAIAAVAIVVGLLHVPSTWTPDLIDSVLKYGDSLHQETVSAVRPGARNLSPSELLRVFIVGDFRACIHVHEHTTAGLLHVFDLAEALAMFFRNNCAAILHTANMAVAMMQHYGNFYLFDPCSRNEQGKPTFQGAACVIKCKTIMKLAKVFVQNCNLKNPNVYTLNAVNVLSLHFFSDAKGTCPPKCEQ